MISRLPPRPRGLQDTSGPRAKRGQALAEFALVVPFFLLLLFGTIEAGRFVLYYQALNNATREGARYAIVHGSNSFCPSGPMPPGQNAPGGCYDPSGANVVKRVKDSAYGLLGSGVAVTPTWGALGNGRDSDVTVTASYTYRAVIPIVPLPAITVRAESKLVINN